MSRTILRAGMGGVALLATSLAVGGCVRASVEPAPAPIRAPAESPTRVAEVGRERAPPKPTPVVAIDTEPVSLAADDGPSPVDRHSAVWTGQDVIFWGGNKAFPLESDGYAPVANAPVGEGGIYNPVADAWSSTPPAPIGPRLDHIAVWSGTEMLVFGGEGPKKAWGDGAAFDPATKHWRTLAKKGGPSPRTQAAGVWTGSELIVAGGHDAGGKPQAGAFAYDPSKDAWRSFGTPAARSAPTLVWTGSEAILCGASGTVGQPVGERSADGKTWVPLPTEGAPALLEDTAVVWAGGRLVVWGGAASGGELVATGATWAPAADSWSPMTTAGAYARESIAAVSTGDLMVVLGQAYTEDDGTAPSLGIYDVANDRWWSMPGPYPSADIAMAWTGTDVIAWGGFDGTNMSPSGERVKLR